MGGGGQEMGPDAATNLLKYTEPVMNHPSMWWYLEERKCPQKIMWSICSAVPLSVYTPLQEFTMRSRTSANVKDPGVRTNCPRC